MNALILLLISVVVLILGYVLYGRHLAKQFGIDPSRPTPAHEFEDGVDYEPAKPIVLVGHHFSSIAGAGPITGPIQAAVFGWLPVFLWILIGGIFFGAVHDFSSLFASVRNKGKSLADIIKNTMSLRAKKLFLVLLYITLILCVSAFLSIVAETFVGTTSDPEEKLGAARAATISMALIFSALLLGMIMNRFHPSSIISTALAVAFVVVCTMIGFAFPIYLSYEWWIGLMALYIIVASVLPVWILLQPRDFMCSFLLYGMIAIAVIGVIFSNPSMNLPAYTTFETEIGFLFPALFITVACGAISGFHSLVASGTTSKQIDNEKNILPIGYGSMLLECLLAVLALIAVGILYSNGMPSGTPTEVFASGITSMVSSMGLSEYESITYSLIILAISAFALTTLDTATRIARMLIQEFFLPEDSTVEPSKTVRFITNPLTASVITTLIAVGIALIGYKTIWPTFGTLNQLIAALTLLALSFWMVDLGKKYKMLLIPAIFMIITTVTSMVCISVSKIQVLMNGFDGPAVAQLAIIICAFVIFCLMTKENIIELIKRVRNKMTEQL